MSAKFYAEDLGLNPLSAGQVSGLHTHKNSFLNSVLQMGFEIFFQPEKLALFIEPYPLRQPGAADL